MILPFEYKADKAPYLHACPTFATNGVQQGLYFISHNGLNVKDIEVARCYRLIDGKVELLTWQIPRAKVKFFPVIFFKSFSSGKGTHMQGGVVQKEFFQDDLYNEIPVIKNPSLSISDWLMHGKAIQRDVMSVQPAGMQKCIFLPDLSLNSFHCTQRHSRHLMTKNGQCRRRPKRIPQHPRSLPLSAQKKPESKRRKIG